MAKPSDKLNRKLGAIRKAFQNLTAEELRALIANPDALECLYPALPTGRPKLDPGVKKYLAKTEDSDERHGAAAIVKTTRAQRDAVRKLTLEVLKKQGIDKHVLGLAEIRGERLDPFAKRDPDVSGREE
jgi:hypothetical protein